MLVAADECQIVRHFRMTSQLKPSSSFQSQKPRPAPFAAEDLAEPIPIPEPTFFVNYFNDNLTLY